MNGSVNTVNEQQKTTDIFRWIAVGLLLAAGIVGNAYYSGESLLYRVLALVVIGALAAMLALQTGKGVAFLALAKDARAEIRKVVWPTHQETVQTTLVVVAVVMVMALILWGLDTLLGWLTTLLLG